MMIFKSTKSTYLLFLVKYLPYATYGFVLLMLIYEYLITDQSNNSLLWSILILSGILLGLVWFVENLINVKYTIDGNKLIVSSGITNREIMISDIQSLVASNYIGYGYKPALGLKGLKLMYESGRMLYISPEEQDNFLKELSRINTSIIIK